MSLETPLPNPESLSPSQPLAGLVPKPVLPRRLLQQAGQAVLMVLLAFSSYLLISHFFLQSVSVVGISMVPTLHDSQRYLLNRWVFHLRSPRPQDIVVLRDPLDNGFSVKRVVARGGDSVCFKDGNVYVNGHKLDEPYLAPGTVTFSASSQKEQLFTCGADQYFVLGDNRGRSIDSRVYGPVPRQKILGLIIR